MVQEAPQVIKKVRRLSMFKIDSLARAGMSWNSQVVSAMTKTVLQMLMHDVRARSRQGCRRSAVLAKS